MGNQEPDYECSTKRQTTIDSRGPDGRRTRQATERHSRTLPTAVFIGWHTFRHTFGTILNANGENPKVIQELLRHATLKVTMDTYVQAVSDEKRNAQTRVVKMLLPGIRRAVI